MSWSQSDRDKAIWYHMEQIERCGSCGTKPAEWDPELGGDRHAYVAETTTCHGCREIEMKQSSVSKEVERNPAIGRGLRFKLRKRREN